MAMLNNQRVPVLEGQLKNEFIRNHLSATAIISKVLPNNLTAVDDRQQLVFFSKTQTMGCWVPLNQFMNIHPSLICLLFYWNGQLKKNTFRFFRHTLAAVHSPNPPGPKARWGLKLLCVSCRKPLGSNRSLSLAGVTPPKLNCLWSTRTR